MTFMVRTNTAYCKLFFLGFAVCLSSCSFHAAPAATTPFITHEEELHTNDNHLPWNASWTADGKAVMVYNASPRKIFIAPVNTEFLNVTPGAEPVVKLKEKDVDAIVSLLQESFTKAVSDSEKTNLQIVDNPKKTDLVLQLALVELTPTRTVVNTVANIGGLVVPGSKAVQGSVAVGGQGASGVFAAGTIAIEMKIIDGKTKKVIAEAKDRQSDPASILPNYRDFQEFGWSRQTIRDWAEQFAKTFSTSQKSEIKPSGAVSVVPW